MNQTDISVFEQLELELAALRIELPSEGRSVTVTDFGARADSDFCNTEAFNQALTYCRREKAEKLIIPKGVYRFKECSQNAHLILDDAHAGERGLLPVPVQDQIANQNAAGAADG